MKGSGPGFAAETRADGVPGLARHVAASGSGRGGTRGSGSTGHGAYTSAPPWYGSGWVLTGSNYPNLGKPRESH